MKDTLFSSSAEAVAIGLLADRPASAQVVTNAAQARSGTYDVELGHIPVGFSVHRQCLQTTGLRLMSLPTRAASGTTRYSTVAIILHWMVALGILTLIVMGLVMDHLHLDTMRVFQLYQLHKSIGITVMFLIALRIGWRLTHRAPALPTDMLPLEKKGAHLVHLALYGVQVLLPLSGWAMVSASVLGIPTVLFGTVLWPDLPVLSTLSDKAPVEAVLKVLHHWAAWGLLALITLHVAAALRHQFVLHDQVLRQMLPSFRASSTSRYKGENP